MDVTLLHIYVLVICLLFSMLSFILKKQQTKFKLLSCFLIIKDLVYYVEKTMISLFKNLIYFLIV